MWPAAGILLASLLNARAIVYHSTNGIAHNVSTPTGALASAGWQYTGKLDVYTGTAIAPNYKNGGSWLYATPTNTPQPCAFFSTRVSRRLPWIWQVVPELAPPPSPTIILIR